MQRVLACVVLIVLTGCRATMAEPRASTVTPPAVQTQPAIASQPEVSFPPKAMHVGSWTWSSAPTISPDHSMAAWDVGTSDGAHVYLRDAGGTRQILFGQVPVRVAGWWPDSSGLLVWDYYGYCSSCNFDGIRLATLSLTGQLHDLAVMDLLAGTYSWSVEGRLLIGTGGDRFVVEANPRVLVCVVQVDACTDVPKPAETADLTPSWSPNGRLIVFARGSTVDMPIGFCRAIGPWQNELEIWIARADGSERQRLVTPGGSYPTWSADGRSITFVHDGTRWSHDLYSGANVDTGVAVPGAPQCGWANYSEGTPPAYPAF